MSMLLVTSNFGPLSTTPASIGSNPLTTVRADDGKWLSTWGNTLTAAGAIHNVGAMRGIAMTTTAFAETYLFSLFEAANQSHISFALRRRDTLWVPWDDLFARAGALYDATRIACAAIGNTIHLIATTRSNGLKHTMRSAAGTWATWNDVLAQTGPLSPIDQLAIAAVGDDLHVVARSGVKLLHTIRFAAGPWQEWRDVIIPDRFERSPIGGLACTGTGSDFHVIVGVGVHLFATTRHRDGRWDQWEDIGGVPAQRAKIIAFAAEPDGSLQAAAGDGEHVLYHARRPAGRNWDEFRGVLGAVPSFVTIECIALAPVERVL